MPVGPPSAPPLPHPAVRHMMPLPLLPPGPSTPPAASATAQPHEPSPHQVHHVATVHHTPGGYVLFPPPSGVSLLPPHHLQQQLQQQQPPPAAYAGGMAAPGHTFQGLVTRSLVPRAGPVTVPAHMQYEYMLSSPPAPGGSAYQGGGGGPLPAPDGETAAPSPATIAAATPALPPRLATPHQQQHAPKVIVLQAPPGHALSPAPAPHSQGGGSQAASAPHTSATEPPPALLQADPRDTAALGPQYQIVYHSGASGTAR
jgi:hypothetical protein